MSIPDLSPALKPFRKFFVQAKQVEKVDPKVAWLLRTYAVQSCFRNPTATKEDKVALIGILDELESSRQCAGMTVEERSDHLLDFALNVFLVGDNQDRAGNATQSTAKCFLSCATFLEAMSLFGEVDPDIEEKRKYALWKAADISKALREGRTPTPGGFGDDLSSNELKDAFGSDDPIAPMSNSSNSFESSGSLSSKSAQPATFSHGSVEDDPWAEFESQQNQKAQAPKPTSTGVPAPAPAPVQPFHDETPASSLGPPPPFSADSFESSFGADKSNTFHSNSMESDEDKAQAAHEAELEAQARQQILAELKAEEEAQANALSLAKAKAEAQALAQMQAQALANAKAQAQAQAQAEAQRQAQAQAKAKTAAASTPKSTSSSMGNDSDDPWAEFYALSGKPTENQKKLANKTPTAYVGSETGDAITIKADHKSVKDRFEAVSEATRLTRHVISSLAFDDTPTAVEKLSQALALLIPYKDETSEYN